MNGPLSPFTIVPYLVLAVFSLVAIVIIASMIRGLAEWISNNQQPVLSEEARVVTKRAEVRGHGHMHRHGHTWTSYYCTFQLGDGTRREFQISGQEYGQVAERDEGTLTFQGTRYHGFRRRIEGGPAPLKTQADY